MKLAWLLLPVLAVRASASGLPELPASFDGFKAPPTAAGRPVEDPLESLERYRAQIAASWVYEVGSPLEEQMDEREKAEARRALKNLAEQISFEGLRRIRPLNPSLTEKILKELRGKRLVFSAASMRSAWASASYHPGTGRLTLGSAGQWYVMAAIDMRRRQAGLGGRGFEGVAPIDAAGAVELQDYENAVFHEFLHAGGAPKDAKHNESSLDRERDPVYACAAQAYPGFGLREGLFGRYYVNTKKACETCAGGRHRLCDDMNLKAYRREYAPAPAIRVIKEKI